jgi:hypothetical protein
MNTRIMAVVGQLIDLVGVEAENPGLYASLRYQIQDWLPWCSERLFRIPERPLELPYSVIDQVGIGIDHSDKAGSCTCHL